MTNPTDPTDPNKPKPRLRIAKPDDAPPQSRRLSPGDRALILDIVTNQVIDGARLRQIASLLKNAHEQGIRVDPKDPNSPRRFLPHVSQASLASFVRQVVAELEDDRKQSRERKVERMIARTMRVIRDATRVRNFSAVIQAEKHLASLEALYAPVHFIVGFDQRDAVMNVLGNMDNAAITEWSERARQDRMDAELHRASVEAFGESVPTPTHPQAPAEDPTDATVQASRSLPP